MVELSVIIVNYNTKKLTLECIASVQKEGELSKEIILVDNGSSDGSVEALRRSQGKSQIILIENHQNLGFSKAVNQGARAAKGKHLLLLNTDTEVKKGAITKLANFAKCTPDAGVVGARLLNGDGTIQASCFYFPGVMNAIREYWLGKKGLFEKYVPKDKKPVVVDAVTGAAFLITPAALSKVGLLDERYFFYFEDIDYCRRVARAGLKVYYFPGASVVHYHGASGKSLASEKNQWRRLIPSSKIYHGVFRHYLLTAILWSGQKWERLKNLL